MSSKKSGTQALSTSTIRLNLAIAISYFLLGIFSQITSIPVGHTAAIWPSAGIALATMIFFGYSVWPGIFLGSFSISAWAFNFNFELYGIYSFIALGATFSALVGRALIQRAIGTTTELVKNRNIIKFLILGGPLSCLISATVGVVTLNIANIISLPQLPFYWLVRWSSDVLGVILFTPALLILLTHPGKFWQQRKISIALPALIIFLFLSVFYWFAIKLIFTEQIDLSVNGLFHSMTGIYVVILLCGLCFAFVFMVLFLVFSGRHLRKDKIVAVKTSHLRNEINIRKNAEQELSITKDKAVSANKAKNQFLSHISHELRTPLNGILGFTQLLQKKPTINDGDKEQLNTIQNCADHLLNLINDILDISKIESGNVKIVSEPFDFKCFLFDLMGVFKLKTDDKNIRFEVVYEDLPDYVDSDEKRLRQIFSNLISNAINFTDEGSVVVTISYKKNQLHFTVTDTGCGISENNHDKIFQPFVQVNSSDFSENGSGLGLTITRQLIQLLNGSIAFKSKLGQGSKFLVLIPLQTCAPSPSKPRENRPITGYKGPEKSIWVVDDNQENATLLQILLQELGFEVRIVNDGFQCLEWLEKSNPDLIFMDLMLPGINGIETNRSILAKIPGQKIIGMSASVFTHEKKRFLDSGCLSFMAKPIQQEEIVRCLNRALDLSWTYYSDIESSKQETSNEILIAEDNEINSLLLENLLINLNFRVEIAHDGGASNRQAAVKILQVSSH